MRASLRTLAFAGCVAVNSAPVALSAEAAATPDGIAVVDDFALDRYLGLWYEIARLDNPFERGLERVTAEYQPIDQDTIRVINRGYNPEKNKWKEFTARAEHTGAENEGKLKVTFFWPFSSGYYILDLDTEDYQYALVTGDRKSYLWILARSPELPPDVTRRLVEKAKQLGFATEELIWVDHS